MSKILEVLAESLRANQVALDLQGRQLGLMFGIVTNNQDPLKLRRIKVTTEAKGGLTETDWVMAMRLIPNYDPPLPLVGTSVIIAAIGGNPHHMIWLGPVINQTNPQDDNQGDPINDNSQTIPGSSDERIEGSLTIKVGKQITIQNDAGASLTLHESGAVILEDKWKNRLTLGGASADLGMSSDFDLKAVAGAEWNLGGQALGISNAGDVQIQNKSVLVIGSTDTRGDDNITRGY
ncbi:MAG: hypothetical protein HC781_21590 [Leptolyngbyaceae cyanobacterium CSU_1_4]|nr:hypothetical protein [Leptolyngbyaceae cyanobacterium CSU_1_4]